MKNIFTVLSILVATLSFAQTGLRITEISYNPPESGSDSTEYIEIYNPTASAINMNGYSFTEGVVYTFPNVSVSAGGYIVVAVDSVAMQNVYGVTAYEWTSGGLSNSGEDITLVDNLGNTIDSVDYDDGSPWPTAADGSGPSIVLCDLTADANIGSNWDTSSTSAGVVVDGHMVYGSPGASDNSCIPQPADLVISEIMYNTPGSDTFEFIEIYNNGSSPVDLTGYHFTQGVTDTLPSVMLPAGGYIVVTIDSIAFYNVFGFSAYEWESGALSNSGEDITLVDNMGVTLDSVDYDDGSPWPTDADGLGYSLVLTDPNSDNLLASSWCLSGDTVVGQVISGSQILASPGSANTCYMAPAPTTTPTYAISVINNTDMNGVADSIGVYCWTKGLVLGVDMRGGTGIQFTIFDGEGIGIFNFNDVSNYVVTEGDSIMIRGTVGQFNGLTQLGSIDSIHVVNTGNTIPSPTVVTSLGESMESTLVRFENAYVNSVSGINFELVSGTDTITMRVDSDTDVLDSLSIAMGDSLCHVTGVVGQFDGTNPYTSGYQLFPRTYMDVDTTCGSITTPPSTPIYPISVINNTDMNGVADSNGVYCWTKGLVLGVDMDGNAGLSFTIFDGEGIGVYNSTDVSNYVVTEGDSIMIRGTVGQFNGLTQLGSIDSIHVVNTGNAIPTPTVVTSLGESMESTLVRFENAYVNSVSGINFELVSGTDTITMRVDYDTDVLDSLSILAGDSLCHVIGIVGQYDSSNPYTSGYQLFPRTYMDVDTTCGGIVTPPAPPVPTYDIATIRTVDANGEPDSLDVLCAIEGIVHGKDMDGNDGYTFALIDDTRGITVHSFVDVDNYVVNQGDELRAVGTVKFYNGLTQFRVDSITVLSTGNCIDYPEVVFELNEETESEAIYIMQVKLEDPSAWPAPGSNANLNIITMDDDTLLMRIDKDTKIADTITSAPSGYFNVSGIGSQFTFSSPYDDGYQIMPQFVADIDTVPTDASGIFVNEAMVDNQTAIADPQGDYDSWIEIYNSTSNPFDLTGHFFGNDDTIYRFERCIPSVVVPANGYLLLWADDEMQDGPEHLPMMLNNTDYIGLVTKDAAIVDTLEWDSALADVSFGHDTDGSGTWVSFEESTPNATNSGGVILSVISVDPVNALSAYPNPVSNGNVNFNKVISFNMYSVTGQLMMQRKNVNQLNVSDLEKGIYIIETTDGEILKMIVK